MIAVLRDVTGQQVVELWHKDHDLQNCDMVVLPGGFSYGDYLRSGAIARFSPIMTEVIAHANRGGYVFGVCNGFQILCESGLLPGALLHNTSHKFICRNVTIAAQTTNSLVTNLLEVGKPLTIPIAHGEGRFYAPEAMLKAIEDGDQVLFRYCDADGQVVPNANPNGALNNIAGITNAGRNVFGMMPHPERAASVVLSNTDGRALFEGIMAAMAA